MDELNALLEDWPLIVPALGLVTIVGLLTQSVSKWWAWRAETHKQTGNTVKEGAALVSSKLWEFLAGTVVWLFVLLVLIGLWATRGPS